MTGNPDNEDLGPLPPNLRFLKTLVTVLTATMILGLLTMVVLFVIRLQPAPAPVLPLPDQIALPDGAGVVSVTYGPDYYAVVTDDARILIFTPGGTLTQEVAIERP